MKDIKEDQLMTLADASRLLKQKHPQFYCSPATLARWCKKRAIPHLCLPACGVTRNYFCMIYFPAIVEHFQRHWEDGKNEFLPYS